MVIVLNNRAGKLTTDQKLRTNLGRSCTFGAYMAPSDGHFMSLWAVTASSRVLGVYIDILRTLSGNIMSLGLSSGITSNPCHSSIPKFVERPLPPIQGAPKTNIFISVARFDMVEEIEVCRREGRDTGMMVKYEDGSKEALGQWHSSQRSVVYTNRDSKLQALVFMMSNANTQDAVVSRIRINDTRGSALPARMFDCSQPGVCFTDFLVRLGAQTDYLGLLG